MSYPKRKIKSVPFTSQLDTIEKVNIEIKHKPNNNPIYKPSKRYTNRAGYGTYNYSKPVNNTFQTTSYVKPESTGNTKILDKLFDPFKPVDFGYEYGTINNNIWSTKYNGRTNGNCIY